MAAELVPAILEKSEEALLKKANRFAGESPIIHIDIMDGKFVPEKSAAIHNLNLPSGSRYEAHLMVMHPEEYFEFLPAEIWQSIIVHAESIGVDQKNIIRKTLAEINSNYAESWLALNPDTDINDICNLGDITNFLVMGVYPGKSGQDLNKNTIDRLKAASQCCAKVACDGGVRGDNALKLAQAGAQRIIAASALHNASDPVKMYHELQQKLREEQ